MKQQNTVLQKIWELHVQVNGESMFLRASAYMDISTAAEPTTAEIHAEHTFTI